MPQTAKARATAQRIADAAAQLFASTGYQATTIADVATAAEVAPGTVMLHFGSKSQLATAAFADQIAAIVGAARPTTRGASVTDDLAAFVTPIYRWYADSESFAPDLLREALFSRGPWADHYARTVANTIEAFAFIVGNHFEAVSDRVADDSDTPGGDAPERERSQIDVVAEGLLADYLLVLFQGLRGNFGSISEQTAHFVRLAESRLS